MLIILLLISKARHCLYKITINHLISSFLHFSMVFIHPCKDNFFTFLCFPDIIMYVLNTSSAMTNMTVKKIRDIIFENYYRLIRFSKQNSSCSLKHQLKKYLKLFANKLT